MKILEIPAENRPRERLSALGPSALSDAELLAIILKTGNKNENVIDMSNRLFSKHSLGKLSGCTLAELQEINGIGNAKACQIQALFELGRRYSKAVNGRLKRISDSKDLFRMFKDELAEKNKEHFYCVLLNSKNAVIGYDLITVGTLNESLIHPREVFKKAIKESACSIALVHNHPSGDPTPSEEDREVTRKIRETGKIIGIELIDHVIIGKEKYKSLL